MLPLTTVWAFTIWKFPGHTFTGKVVLNVSDHERTMGSRMLHFLNQIFLNIGITDTRLTDKIRKQGKMRGGFSIKEILTDYIMKQKYGWSHTI
jgi:hypothetical protein